MRLTDEFMATVDAWAAKQDDTPRRSEAIRRLVELGLKAPTPTRATRSTPNKVRAAELAAKTIDKMSDHTATADERVQRRRRLTKGPGEFREARVDRPKVKGK
jgi:Excisionase-like protein